VSFDAGGPDIGGVELGGGEDEESDEHDSNRHDRDGISPELSGRIGATLTGGIGTTIGAGDMTVDDRELQPLEEHDARQSAAANQVLLTTTLYFRTAEDTLGPEDEHTLDQVIGSMLGVDRVYPGAMFELQITGYASARWLAARSPEDALARNRALAARRTGVVHAALNQRLEALRASFTEGVVDLGEAMEQTDSRATRGDFRQDNAQTDRSVSITVRWHPSDVSRRAQAMSVGD